MTVKCINQTQKAIIAQQYAFIKVPVKDLASDYKVSTRTINRVLVELGVAPVRRKKKPIPVEPVVQPKQTFVQKMKSFLKFFFTKKTNKIDDQSCK